MYSVARLPGISYSRLVVALKHKGKLVDVRPNGLMTKQLERRAYSVRGLANWILDYTDCLGVRHTNMGLNKLVYFAVEALLQQHGILLTNAKIEAWEHGPVFRELYHDFKKHGDQPVTTRSAFFSPVAGRVEIASVVLNDGDRDAVMQALSPIISASAAELRRLSHAEGSAWHSV